MTEDLDSSTFAAELRRRHPRPAVAALLFAREIAYPDLRPSRYVARLSAWASAAVPRVSGLSSAGERGAALAQFLFDEEALRGNREEYYDPRNSFLNEVMDRRLGLPIALSVIFLDVAERAGLTAEGIALPGHFIVAVRDGETQHFFDPFHRGAAVNRGELSMLLRTVVGYNGPFQEEWLQPASFEAIMARMLYNLRGVYLQGQNWQDAHAVVERLAELQPAVPEHLRDLGLLDLRLGSLRSALSHLEGYLVAMPGADDVAQIRATAESVYRQLARLN